LTPRPPRPSSRLLSVCLGLACLHPAWAQVEPPLPPNILGEPGEPALAQLPEDREPLLEEIVVIAEESWRLPDLGSTWRLEHERPTKSRLTVSVLPLYDPELADRLPDLFLLNKQEERVGYLELFRIRFGGEPERSIVPTVMEPRPSSNR